MTPLRVLLVEDSSVYALQTEVSLAKAAGAGFSIVTRGSLSEAVAEVRAGGIDCVVLDLGLPDAEGLEALTRVQQVDPTLPVVVLSGEESEALAVQAVNEGAQDFLMKVHTNGEQMLRSIRHAIQRKQRELELVRQAFHDALTGLPNRELFLDRLATALAREERSGRLVAVMFVDLDRFKDVNDTMGHDAGDLLLCEVGQRLVRTVRPSDAVARLGGDEFLLMCDGLEEEDEALIIAERMSDAVAQPVDIHGHEVLVRASIGIAIGRDRSTPPDLLIQEADRAMYCAKRASRPYVLADGLPRKAARAPH